MFCFTSISRTFGYDFKVDDICYNITSSADLTVGVTYYSTIKNLYSGDISIPEFVSYLGNTYRVTSIEDYAFDGCKEMSNISIPNSVTFIGDYAFSGCTGLPVKDNFRYADVCLVAVIDRSKEEYTILDGTKFIGSTAFKSCYNMKSITIPQSVIGIGNEAFNNRVYQPRITSKNEE